MNNCVWTIKLTIESDGSITLSMSGLKQDVKDHILWNILSEYGTVIKEDTIVQGTVYTKTKTVRATLTWGGGGAGVAIKAVPQGLLTIFKSDYISRSLFDLNTLTHQVTIIQGDTYLEETDTVTNVLSRLGIRVIVPAALDYFITNLTIKEGADAYQVLRSLFPIPGATITKINDTWYVNVQYNDGVLDSILGDLCITHDNIIQHGITIVPIGATTRPLTSGSAGGGGSQCDASWIANLLGGVFGLTRIEITATTSKRPVNPL